MSEVFGPAEWLHAALRTRAPRIAVSIVRDEDEGLSRVSVTYRGAGPWLIGWDGTSYTWRTGPCRGLSVGTNAEKAADCISVILTTDSPH